VKITTTKRSYLQKVSEDHVK